MGADFSVEVYDWNKVERAKQLGSAKIDLAELMPSIRRPLHVQLSHIKRGNKGEVNGWLTFEPITTASRNLSTSSAEDQETSD